MRTDEVVELPSEEVNDGAGYPDVVDTLVVDAGSSEETIEDGLISDDGVLEGEYAVVWLKIGV